MKHIPNLQFKKNYLDIEFELISLTDLFQKTSSMKHRLDKPHRLNFFSIIYIMKGSGKHFIDFQTYNYSENSIITTSKGQVHSFDINSKREGFQILFTEKFLQRFLINSDNYLLFSSSNEKFYKPIINVNKHYENDFLILIGEIKREFVKKHDTFRKEILSCLLKTLLLRIERIKESTLPTIIDPYYIKIYKEFKLLYAQKKLLSRNAMDYAKKLSISTKQLNESCRICTSFTAKQCIDQWLILEIKRQLVCSSLSVKEIAFESGFDESTNFVKYFKLKTGLTPRKFKESIT